MSDQFGTPSAPPPPPAPIVRKRNKLSRSVKIGLIIVVVLLIGGIAAATRKGAATPAAAASSNAAAVAASSSPPISSTAQPSTATSTSNPTRTSTKTTTSTTRTTTTTTTTSTQIEEPIMPDEVHAGTGDDVIDLTSTGARIFKFECGNCERNVIVHGDGAMSLVNEIGAYSGRRILDGRDGENTTSLEIKADGDWTVTISDLKSITPTDGPAAGVGDDVLFMSSTGTKARIVHMGEGNFIVHGYGGDRIETAVNEIGDYEGTVKLSMPGFVEVQAEPGTAWGINPS